MLTLEKAAAIVEALQNWLEDSYTSGEIPTASLTYTQYTMSISVDGICIWDDQTSGEDNDAFAGVVENGEEFTLEMFKAEWLSRVRQLAAPILEGI